MISMNCLFDYRRPSLVRKNYSQIDFLVASVRVIYLALVYDSVIIDCFFEYQQTGFSFSININLL